VVPVAAATPDGVVWSGATPAAGIWADTKPVGVLTFGAKPGDAFRAGAKPGDVTRVDAVVVGESLSPGFGTGSRRKADGQGFGVVEPLGGAGLGVDWT
jgi:hypothetical protein